jgi:calcineurin-like phosphoesterase family protein
MTNLFLTADTHFGHWGVCKFLTKEGNKLRPWNTPDEMDEEMIELWNQTVRPNDKVYLLGDYVINRRAIKTASRLNGKKCLIKGNHDIFRLDEYSEHFYDIRGYHILDNMILSHIPIHECQLDRYEYNIHGHLHSNRVLNAEGNIDPRYFCVSVEHTDFRPISFEEVKTIIKRCNK